MSTEIKDFELNSSTVPKHQQTALDYLKERGISLATATKYHLKYSVTTTFVKDVVGIVIPTGGDSYIIRYINPLKDWKRYCKSGLSRFFNFNAILDNDGPIFVTEGEFDALSIIQEGKCAVALGGAGNAVSFMQALEKTGKHNSLILVLDHDLVGLEGTDIIKHEAAKLGIPCLVPHFQKVKDINELLCKDAVAFAAMVSEWEDEAKKLEPVPIPSEDPPRAPEKETAPTPTKETAPQTFLTNRMDQITASFEDEIQAFLAKPQILTGFKELDSAFGGGVREGVYVLGGAPSAGKSTFCLQVASNIAAQGHDVILFSYEMTANEIHAKNISRTHCLSGGTVQLTTNDVLRGGIFKDVKKGKAYHDALKKMQGINKHLLYFAEDEMNVSKIRKIVDEYFSTYNRPPVVLIDYLQLVPPTSDRLTDKQNIDKIMLTLRQLKNKGVPCFFISSLSRASYDSPITLSSFKESGSIEFSADIALALDYEAMYTTQPNAKGKVEIDWNRERSAPIRKLLLTVLKNRLGEAGKQIRYDFVPAGNMFQEKGIF